MVKNKLTKRQIQAQNTQDKVYRTAVELIEKKGFENITVDEICKTAGVSVGSFYNCFKSKNDILDEVYRVADDYFLNVVANDLKEGSTHNRIIAFFRYYADYNVNRGLDFIKQLYNVHNRLFITKGRHMQTVLQSIIEDGQKIGEISTDMTSIEIVDYLFIAVRGVVYDWCLHNGEYDLVEFVDNYVRRLVKVVDSR
ncbi:MAG: TetR/AcrR family transcriptional regulator [Clostridiaceae bacterium]